MSSQKEHLILLLANFKEYIDTDEGGDAMASRIAQGTTSMPETSTHSSSNQPLLLEKEAILQFHTRLFNNYTKWCKYLSQTPHFMTHTTKDNREEDTTHTSDRLADLVLFFLIWGEAGNFRQVPELLCFLFHGMASEAEAAMGQLSRGQTFEPKEPGTFLAKTIRPMYDEVKKDNDKKTPMGARAAHRDIRNYDDFNEFFWTKKCLRYNPETIVEAFASANKHGVPTIVKKTFCETRSWLRALFSFRRIFVSQFVLFLAVVGFAVNMVLVCPDTAIMYQPGLGEIQVFGKQYYKNKNTIQYRENSDALVTEFVRDDPVSIALSIYHIYIYIYIYIYIH